MRASSDVFAGHGAPYGPALRVGQVLGERYQVLAPGRIDPFSAWYRAFDQEFEVEVALRAVHSELLPDETSRRKLIETLEPALGRGGRYLSALLDVDRDGPRVYAIEALGQGSCLRTILDQREAAGRRFRLDEILALVARLGAALSALPAGLAHGDLRAENITIDDSGALLLGGGMLPAALGEGVIAATLQGHPDRPLYAPELAQGHASTTADLYGVGLIAIEALAGPPGPSPIDAISASLGGTGDALAHLLAPAPQARAQSLDALLAVLARQLGVAVPTLEPGAYWDGLTRHVRPLVGEPTDPSARLSTPSVAPAFADVTMPRIDLRSAYLEDALDAIDEPYEPVLDAVLLDAPRLDDDFPAQDPRDLTRRVVYPFADEEIEPLVASAPSAQPEAPAPSAQPGAPAPAAQPLAAQAPAAQPRAARPQPIEGAAADGTQEISLDDFPELADEDDPFADEPTTMLLADELLISIEEPAPRARRKKEPVGPIGPVTMQALKPIPRARRPDSLVPATTGPVLFDDSAFGAPAPQEAPAPAPVAYATPAPVAPAPVAAAPVAPAPAAPAPVEPAAPVAHPAPVPTAETRAQTQRPTLYLPPAAPPAPAPRRGLRIVLGAAAIALTILTASLIFAAYQRSVAQEQREQYRRQRYEELRTR